MIPFFKIHYDNRELASVTKVIKSGNLSMGKKTQLFENELEKKLRLKKNNIAAVSNRAGNVMAIMPHPERTANGDQIFESMNDFIDKKESPINVSLTYTPKIISPQELNLNDKSVEWVIGLIISDNEAKSVNNALRRRGFDVEVSRCVHWEINVESDQERVLDEISFTATDRAGEKIIINKEYINKNLDTLVKDTDLSKFIL